MSSLANTRSRPHLSRAAKAAVPAVVFAAVLALSVVSGRPEALPGAALGSVWLLHVERAAVGLGAVGTVWLVGWRALHGHFPVRFGNIEYSSELTSSADKVADVHERRIKLLEDRIDLADTSSGHVESESTTEQV